ncbi:hypothetical protein N7467_007261 [Penicillium canescens]|nr:hypothetical protein N7467_007261 [Penicillium canescens]
MAVENRDLVMAEMLLDYGADVDVRGDEYMDPYIFYATLLFLPFTTTLTTFTLQWQRFLLNEVST